MTYWYLLPALAVCIVFSAFFSASEIVFGSVNRLHLNRNAEKGNKKASDALRLADNYGETISTILVGNNLVNICASSMASLVANELFGPVRCDARNDGHNTHIRGDTAENFVGKEKL